MKNKAILIFCLLMGLAFTGCKTTEKNYRDAYEKALNSNENRADFDDTIYGRYRRAVRTNDAVTATGDTVSIQSTYVTVTPDGGGIAENLKKYCVVAAEFKQLFNARSVQQRLTDGGIPGAFIVQTREPFYYVLAGSFATLNEALALQEQLRKSSPLPLKAPAPYILSPSQIR